MMTKTSSAWNKKKKNFSKEINFDYFKQTKLIERKTESKKYEIK